MDTSSGLDALVGAWRLRSLVMTFIDDGQQIEPYGRSPEGWMMFEPGGRIMFLFTRANREPPASDAERVGLFQSMTAYTGTVRREGSDAIVTMIDLAWDPSFRGEQKRFFTLEGDRLRIRTPEQTHPVSGDRLIIAELEWQRAD